MTINFTKLSSGISVVTDQIDHLESAALGVWVNTGSRHETLEQHGISHFLEHMAFKGTRNRSARDIAEQIESVGGEVNAATSLESTTYHARVLKDDVPLALEILSDILVNSTFEADEITREQHVILQEIGSCYDSPEERVFDLFLEAAYPDQAIGRPILGTPDTVTSFDRSALQQYLDTRYKAPELVIAAAGAVDHDSFVADCQTRFGSFEAEVAADPVTAHYRGGDLREKRDLMETQILLGFEGYSHKTDDYYAAGILSGILGGGMSSRLFQEVREKHGLCYSIYSFHWAFNDSGIFGIHAATGGDDVEELMPLIFDELRKVTEYIDEEELARAKTQARAGLLMALESPSTRAGQIARQTMLFGKPKPMEEMLEKLDKITCKDITHVAAAIHSSSPMTVAAVGQVDSLADYQSLQIMLRS